MASQSSDANDQSGLTVSEPAGIDPRGPRFGAAVTAILLIGVIFLQGLDSPWPALILLAFIAFSFAIGARNGAQRTWQGAIFRKFVQPRLAPPADLEDPRPPKFAQLVGLLITDLGVAFGLIAAIGAIPGLSIAVTISAAIALIAAFLNAVFGLCLGCEMYLLMQRSKDDKPTTA